MRRYRLFASIRRALAVAGVGLLLAAGPAAAQRYAIRDLGGLGGTSGLANGINAAGQVVGSSNLPGDRLYHAYLFSGGPLVDLGTFGGSRSSATAINDSGDIVGFAYGPGDQSARVFLHSSGVMKDLRAFSAAGMGNSSAVDINNAGQVVGWAAFPGQRAHAFLYEREGVKDLGTLGGARSQALAINEAGVICGDSEMLGGTAWRAFLYRDGVMKALGTLGGGESHAYDLNDAGQIVGWAGTAAGPHAFLHSEGRMQDLGALRDGTSQATGINGAGQIVGESTPPGSQFSLAVLWQNGVIQDLNTLIPAGSGWYLETAYRINASGRIIGNGYLRGAARPFLLTPVPN